MESVLKMTQYFRDSIAAKASIDLSNKRVAHTTLESIESGYADNNWFHYLGGKKEDTQLEIMIVVKTIQPTFQVQEKVDTKKNELEGIFFLPAILHRNSALQLPENKVPWIARDYLNPIIDKELAIGDLEDFDHFMEVNYKRYLDLNSWHEYFQFARDMFKKVTKQDIYSNRLENIIFDENVYVLKDDTVQAARKILDLYDELLTGDWQKSMLYQNFMDHTEKTISNLIPNTPTIAKKHIGQMNGEYPLSPSQRESINHFNGMEEGEVLAVNGPPGTGKTTLLQSIVANLFVKHAVNRENPPRIVGTSTNNRAVQNIVDSFGSIKRRWPNSSLETRWIEGVHSFAVYFPSKSKSNKAMTDGYQVTTPYGDHFFEQIEHEENIEKSKEKIRSTCAAYFQEPFSTIEGCENKLHQRLCELVKVETNMLELMKQWEERTDQLGMGAAPLSTAEQDIVDAEDTHSQLRQRYADWENHFKKLPFYYRWFSFIPAVHKKVQQKINVDLEPYESDLENSSHKAVLERYSEKISDARKTVEEKKQLIKELQDYRERLLKEKQQLEQLIQTNVSEEVLYSLDQLNAFLDVHVRYTAFWLAVHYYECRWVRAKRLTEKQHKKTFKNVLNTRYNNLSMVAPCYVMTFYKLPELAYAFDNGENYYLYNNIDLLIIDEAGQVTPEIAASSFALAKKAVVVGDTHQIEPIWNITESLDYSLALSAGAASGHDTFEQLKKAGLHTAGSSAMEVASNRCRYQKYDQRGLFLSEHRRCYDEIINYCNQLVYENKLEPKRGSGVKDEDYPLQKLGIPQFGLKQIDSEASTQDGGSRLNKEEATAIANWLNENFETILSKYPEKSADDVIGVITPFKRQVACIQSHLTADIKKKVHVGTVHTFQGGELPIIMLSTVYGKKDTGFFIDKQSNLLNVAVSRAKDSFLVFGDKNFMSDSVKKPSGLLKEKVQAF